MVRLSSNEVPDEKSKLRRNQSTISNKKLAMKRQQKSLTNCRLLKSECETKSPSLRSSLAKTTKEKNVNKTTFITDIVSSKPLYVDMGQQDNLNDIQIDYCDEKPISIDNQYPIEFAMDANKTQQLQCVDFAQLNEKPGTSRQNCSTKTISHGVIDFFFAQAKAYSDDPELNFYRSLIPDIMKLSDKRRRLFKEVVLCTLNKLLDENDHDHTIKM